MKRNHWSYMEFLSFLLEKFYFFKESKMLNIRKKHFGFRKNQSFSNNFQTILLIQGTSSNPWLYLFEI